MLFRPPGTHEQTERQKYGAKEGETKKNEKPFSGDGVEGEKVIMYIEERE